MDYQEKDNSYNNNDYDYGQQEPSSSNRQVKGLTVAIVILFMALCAVCFMYWQSVEKLRGSEADLIVERDTITNRLNSLMGQYGTIKFDNDTLNRNLATERHKADSLMQRLKKERSLSYAKLKQYERELGTLRSTMQGFVRTIDSLNRLNQKLVGENLKYRKEISSLRTETASAKETAAELNIKIAKSSVVRARDISLRAVNKRDKEVAKAKQANHLVATFVLTANELSNPGERQVFIRIIGPDGIDLQDGDSGTFNFEGQMTPYSAARAVDYTGEDLPFSVYYNGSGLFSGKYTVMVYMDGHNIGQNDIILK